MKELDLDNCPQCRLNKLKWVELLIALALGLAFGLLLGVLAGVYLVFM